jgi:hypothetical protein
VADDFGLVRGDPEKQHSPGPAGADVNAKKHANSPFPSFFSTESLPEGSRWSTGKATDAPGGRARSLARRRDRARLRQNLGLILQTTAQQNAKGQQFEQLQALLPTVTGDASIEVEQVNLAAYGLKFPGLNPIIGPFQVIDFRAYLTQTWSTSRAGELHCGEAQLSSAKLTARTRATWWC